MDVDQKLEELSVLVEEAKAVPLSASCMVNRAVVLDLIDDIRDALPSSLSDADQLLAEHRLAVWPADRDHLVGHADILVAVDVIGAPEGDGSLVPSRMDSLFGASQLMMQSHIALKMKICQPDIYIRPEVNAYKVLDFFKARQILEISDRLKDPLKRELAARMEDFVRR